ncbi:head GIN domain-containing protein [Flavobacterium ardleyense]|uniref:Head GIN domain-containing protein n=1 Tax=Flavobacterium ardleyense TaxID=2038737 RepID=A0ABW5Z9I5_9FLAO
MKNSLTLVLVLLAIGLTSCNGRVNIGSGNIITEKRTVNENFDRIEASTGVNVIITQASPTEIEVETDDNVMKYVITKVENGALVIKLKRNTNIMSSIDVRVQMPSIVGLKASSGSTIITKNILRGTSLDIKSSSGSDIKAVIEYENVNCATSSGSTMTVSGKALQLQTNSSSGSDIDANDLVANEIFSKASSGSGTRVNPIVKLEAKASSGSTIEYVQMPKTLTKNESSGASVEQD